MVSKVAHLQDVSTLDKAHKPTIIVTGGAGFIGSNFVRLLLNCYKYNVFNLDLLSYAGNIESIADILDHPDHLFVKGDITDRSLIVKLLTHHQPIAVVNFAAESHVDRSIDDAGPFIRSNIVGVYELLEASRSYYDSIVSGNNKSFRFLQVSTDEVYGDLGEHGYFNEESNYQPSSPYSASKAAADHLVHAYYRTYGLPTLITNCSNNYGPYQFPEKLIPVVIYNAINGNAIPIYGDGKNVRDWLYVEDHCDAILTVLENGNLGDKYCIGGACEKANIDIAIIVCAVLDELCPLPYGCKYHEQIEYVEDRDGHDRRYAIDFEKINRDLKWSPKETFESGVTKTVQWYLDNQDWCDMVMPASGEDTILKRPA